METTIRNKNLKPGDVLLVKDIVEGEATVMLVNPKLSEASGELQTAAVAADMVQQIFSHLDQIEKIKRRSRHVQGIAAAKARGSKFGRRPKERPAIWESLRDEWQRGEISAREGARRLGVSHVTFLNWASEDKVNSI